MNEHEHKRGHGHRNLGSYHASNFEIGFHSQFCQCPCTTITTLWLQLNTAGILYGAALYHAAAFTLNDDTIEWSYTTGCTIQYAFGKAMESYKVQWWPSLYVNLTRQNRFNCCETWKLVWCSSWEGVSLYFSKKSCINENSSVQIFKPSFDPA
jgi:hypothetical protein